MNGREIISRAIMFEAPERIGLDFDAGLGLIRDFIGGGYKWESEGWKDAPTAKDGTRVQLRTDEWGNLWHRLGGITKGEVREPVLKTWDDMAGYRLPDLDRKDRWAGLAERFKADRDHFRLGSLPGFPFNIMRYMRRIDNFLADCALNRDKVMDLQEKVLGLLDRMIIRIADCGADGIVFCEDWGTQDRLLVSPKMWRDIFKDGFERLCRTARTYGLSVWMHSCGYIYDIIEDLIEVGIDVLQIDQLRLLGIEKLSKDFGGRISFWSPVDIQTTLQTGDKEKIQADARLMIRALGGFDGGFIAKDYGDNVSIGTDPKWQNEWAYQAFVEYGKYPLE